MKNKDDYDSNNNINIYNQTHNTNISIKRPWRRQSINHPEYISDALYRAQI